MKISLTEEEIVNILRGHISIHYGVDAVLRDGYMADYLTFETLSNKGNEVVVNELPKQTRTKGETREEKYITIDLDKFLGGKSS